MQGIRFAALQEVMRRKPSDYQDDSRVSDVFGQNVFNKKAMAEYMTPEAYKSVLDAIDKGSKINREIADQVAAGMKSWALSKGATHYNHWFQPLT